MDYSKSLTEVWKDTMEFMNKAGLLPEWDIIPFGKLVKSLLMRHNDNPLQQLFQLDKAQPSSSLPIEYPKAGGQLPFPLNGYVIGCIVAVGPSTAEILSSAQKADQWTASILENFRTELGEAHRENDVLIRYILDSDQRRLESTYSIHVSNVAWMELRDRKSDPLDAYQRKIEKHKAKYAVSSHSRNEIYSSHISPSPVINISRLCLVQNCHSEKTTRKMGIATSLAQPGDLVCEYHRVKRVLLLRQTESSPNIIWRMFGTALLTSDLDSSCQENLGGGLGYDPTQKMELKMDAETVYAPLS